MTDHAGHAIVVGSVVKLECTITAINEVDSHFAGVIVKPTFPASQNPTISGSSAVPLVNTSGTGPLPHNVQLPAKFAFDGSQLTWVSG